MSPYGTKISIFVKSNSDKNFLQVIVPLRDQNFNFWKKCFRQFFSLTKQVSQHFTLIEAKRSTKIFSNHFFKKFYKLLSPYGTKISIFGKSVSDNFFHLQNMFHNISRWLKPKNRQKFFWNNFSKFFTSYCPPMGPKFQFLKKYFRRFFSLTKHVSQHFTLIEAKKSAKILSHHFFKKFYKLLSPYGTKISIFGKSVSDNFFHLQKKFHNISRWLKPKNRQKFFRTNFSKFFTSYCPPMGPKFQFLKKVFPTIFFTYKNMFHNISRWLKPKNRQKILSHHFFKKFCKLLSPYGTKISIFGKSVSDNFFTYKTCFTTFHVDWSQKIGKNFVAPFFQKILQVFVPLRDQNFNFWKKCFRQYFSLTKHVSKHFTLIEAKKSTKIFSNQFFKIFYKLLSPYGTKISIFEKSISDDFFHLQNMFHNISRWLKPKNRQKFCRTIFSKNFTSYCPPTGQKFQFLEKVCPTIFFTYKKSFTTFHVDWSQKIDKNFFEPFFQKILQVIVPLRDQNFNFCKNVIPTKIFYKLLSPYGNKISIFGKSVSDNFFTYKTSFTTFHVDWSQKIDKNFFQPFFQKSLQVIVPLWDQNFNFCKK